MRRFFVTESRAQLLTPPLPSTTASHYSAAPQSVICDPPRSWFFFANWAQEDILESITHDTPMVVTSTLQDWEAGKYTESSLKDHFMYVRHTSQNSVQFSQSRSKKSVKIEWVNATGNWLSSNDNLPDQCISIMDSYTYAPSSVCRAGADGVRRHWDVRGRKRWPYVKAFDTDYVHRVFS